MYSDSVFNREYVVCSNEEFDRFMASGGKNLLTALMRQYHEAGNEALYQEVCLTAAHAIATHDPCRIDVKLTTYVWECCMHTILMNHRKKHAKKRAGSAKDVSFEEFREKAFDESRADDEEAEFSNLIVYPGGSQPEVEKNQQEKKNAATLTQGIDDIAGHTHADYSNNKGYERSVKYYTVYGRTMADKWVNIDTDGLFEKSETLRITYNGDVTETKLVMGDDGKIASWGRNPD